MGGRRSARKSHNRLGFCTVAKCLWGGGKKNKERLSNSPANIFSRDDELSGLNCFYTRGGQSPVSGMRWRNEMSESICSGWFDTRQAWPASRPELRCSETWSELMGCSLKLHRRVQGRSGQLSVTRKNRANAFKESISGDKNGAENKRELRHLRTYRFGCRKQWLLGHIHATCAQGFYNVKTSRDGLRSWIAEAGILWCNESGVNVFPYFICSVYFVH